MFAIATDMDRTLLPDGKQKTDRSMGLFKEILIAEKPKLIYVTGRNIRLVNRAIKRYKVPRPDYLVAEVGTVIYHKSKRNILVQNKSWIRHIHRKTKGWDITEFKEALGDVNGLRLQNREFQNRFKLSYNIRNHDKARKAVLEATKRIRKLCRSSEIVYSVDETKGLGLLDILPKHATKLSGLDFVRKKLGIGKSRVVFCGDSGNDLLPFCSGYPSVMVRNAIPEVRKRARQIAREKGISHKLYIAKGIGKHNGYYVSGVIEGLAHFGFISKDWLKS